MNLKDKIGQGRVTWVLVVMLIAIVVMIVLLLFFDEGVDKGQKGLFSCEGKSGICLAPNPDLDNDCGLTCKAQDRVVSTMLQCSSSSEGDRCCCLKKD